MGSISWKRDSSANSCWSNQLWVMESEWSFCLLGHAMLSTNKPMDRLDDCLTDQLASHLTVCLTDWLTDKGRAKGIYILTMAINKSYSFLFLAALSKKSETFPLFYKTVELIELKYAVVACIYTWLCNLCFHGISFSPKQTTWQFFSHFLDTIIDVLVCFLQGRGIWPLAAKVG